MAVIVMTWTPTNTTTIGYEVRYALNSPTPNYLYIGTVQTNIVIEGLLNNEVYVIGVRAICEGGLYSEWTQKMTVTCDEVSNCYMEGIAVLNP